MITEDPIVLEQIEGLGVMDCTMPDDGPAGSGRISSSESHPIHLQESGCVDFLRPFVLPSAFHQFATPKASGYTCKYYTYNLQDSESKYNMCYRNVIVPEIEGMLFLKNSDVIKLELVNLNKHRSLSFLLTLITLILLLTRFAIALQIWA